MQKKTKKSLKDFAALISAALCLTIAGIGIVMLLKPGLDSQDAAIHTVTFWMAEGILIVVALLLCFLFNQRRKKKNKLRSAQ
jgi:integral membrane sensor domain MASE1